MADVDELYTLAIKEQSAHLEVIKHKDRIFSRLKAATN